MPNKPAQHTPTRYAGSRHLSPDYMSKAGMNMYVVTTQHPNGEWESIFCKTEEIAQLVEHTVNSHAALVAALEACGQYLEEQLEAGATFQNLNFPTPKGKPVRSDIVAQIHAALQQARGKDEN